MQKDKILHFVVSALLMIIINCLFNVKVAVITTLAIGALKEVVWDYALNNGKASWQDFLADVVGTLAGLVITLFI